MATFVQLVKTPCSVFWIECPSGLESQFDPEAQVILTKLLVENWECAFRGVPVDRLNAVLEHGIDVYPTSSVIFAETPEKAFEYGGWPKLLLALKLDCLMHTFKEISADVSDEGVKAVRVEYPTIIRSRDGSKLWCTRLNEDDPRIASDYEVAYARWIPSNPWDALRAVFIRGRPEDHDAVRKFVHQNSQVKRSE